MGITHSHKEGNQCGAVCNCFISDKNVKQRDITRYCSSKWIWSQHHDSMLIESLTNKPYNIPIDIIYLIKNITFSLTHLYHIFTAKICKETYYSKISKLIHKNLCYEWYLSRLSVFQSFEIAVISKSYKDKKDRQCLYDCFYNHSLPALQSENVNPLQFESISMRRTLFVDNLQIAIKLFNIDPDNISNKMEHAQIHLITFSDENEIKDFHRFIAVKQKIYILVTMDNQTKNDNKPCIISAQNQLCRHYNIPCIHVSSDSDESIQDLFVFAIKYYWFSMVNK